MEARRFHASDLQYFLDDQAHSPLHDSGSRVGHWLTEHDVANPVVTIQLVGDLGFCYHHHILFSDLDRPNSLVKTKSPAVADVVHPKI